MSAVLAYCNIGIHSDSTGTGSNLSLGGLSFADCTTNILIENANTTGYFAGYMEYDKYDVDPDSTFFITNRDANIITVGKEGADFTSVKDAMDSITTNSSTNNYIVQVGPGIFVEDTIQMKEYVTINGTGFTTIIQADDVNKHLILAIKNSGIKECVLTGVSGAGYAAVYHAETSSTGFDKFIIRSVVFGANTQHVISTSATSTSTTYIEFSFMGGTGNVFDKGFTAEAGARMIVRSLTTSGIVSTYPTYVFKATGTGSEITVSASLFRSGSTSSLYWGWVADGGLIEANSVNIRGFGTGIYSENTGSAPTIKMTAAAFFLNTNDINIEHPGTLGTINGILTKSKVTIDEDSTISISYSDVSSTGVGAVSLGDMYQGSQHDRLINLSKLVREGSMMGVISGGLVSIDSGRDIDIEAGNGFLVDATDEFVKEITWSATTLTIAANTTAYIYVDTNAVVQQSSSRPDTINNVYLARVRTDSSGFDLVVNVGVDPVQYGNKNEDMLRLAFGSVYSSGSLITENSTARKIDISSGKYYYGTKLFEPVGGAAQSFTLYYKDGSGGYTQVESQDTIPNDKYDDASGTLANLTTSYYAKFAVYVCGDADNEAYYVVYPQAQYENLVDVQGAAIPTAPTWMAQSISLIASIIIKQGQSAIEQIIDERQRLGFKASAVSAISAHGDLTGLNLDDHAQYLLVSGTRAMSGALNMGSQNITSAGTLNGVTVETHASRHAPGVGADKLTTAAPSSNLTASTTNAEGTSNTSYSRADHSHAITTGAAANQTPDQTSAAGTSASLARADHVHNIPAAAPSSIGTANAKGSNATFALSDHIHDHGSQTTATHHAAVTQSVNGFMSATDKTKLDNMLGYVMTATQASSSSTYASVTELTTASLATGTYAFEFVGGIQSANTNTGHGIRINAVSATMSVVFAKWHLALGAAGFDESYIYGQTTPTQNTTSGSMNASNTNFVSSGSGVFTLTGAGTVAIQLRSETSNAVTLQIGTMLKIRKIA
jgi:hypothetical protein